MSSVLESSRTAAIGSTPPIMQWLPVVIGVAVLFVPTYIDLIRGPWTRDENLHGPIVLAVSIWLAWQAGPKVRDMATKPSRALGWASLVAGLLLYVVGRSQQVAVFEVGSQIPVLFGALLILKGKNALRYVWFPLFFLAFMVPLPGFLVDALTNPLKQHVSAIAENLLYSAGYPVARSGVILTIGNYQLLVADACSGLHSLISMLAMGLLYVFLSGHKGVTRNAVLVLSLLPIAFAANVARVIVLVLVTYYFGDEAGQGFIHDFSGVFLFVIGLLLLFAIDALLGRVPWFKATRGAV